VVTSIITLPPPTGVNVTPPVAVPSNEICVCALAVMEPTVTDRARTVITNISFRILKSSSDLFKQIPQF
jgi:hypothetical protein